MSAASRRRPPEDVDFIAEGIALLNRAARKLENAALKASDAGDTWTTAQALNASEAANRLARSLDGAK